VARRLNAPSPSPPAAARCIVVSSRPAPGRLLRPRAEDVLGEDDDLDAAVPRPPFIAVVVGDGVELAVADGADALRIDTPEEGAQRRVAAALELLYVPYVFGARSPLGVDCSGLVTSAWMRDGRTPARDVWQQAFAGELVATAWHRTNIRAGDQLFFIRDSGKLYHTAIALDATHFVHSSPPCVLISSFDPHDPLYEEEYERYFFMAKRP